MTQRVWCDISDIVSHARKSGSVSGIQRVQARIIGLLACQQRSSAVRCIFARTRHGRMWQCPAAGLFDAAEFSSGRLLATLGVRSARAVYAHELRAYVRAGGAGMGRRLLRRGQVALASWLAPRRLEAMGFTLPEPTRARRTAVARAEQLGAGDVLFLPGATWAQPAVMRYAKRSRRRGCTVVSFIHDVLPATHPQFFTVGHARRFARFLTMSRSFTSRFMCSSAYTRDALSRILADQGWSVPIDVVPLAHEFSGFPRGDRAATTTPRIANAIGADGFVLCVGTIEIRKNGTRLLESWSRLLDALGAETPRLVFAGRRGWKLEAFETAYRADARLRNAVVFVEDATDRDLAWMYQHCAFTVFPSLAEGWGLPVGEAAWFGKYSVVSSRTSLPEVCGSLVAYIDPEKPAELVAALARVIQNPALRHRQEAAISAAMLRSWDDVAAQCWDVLQQRPETA